MEHFYKISTIPIHHYQYHIHNSYSKETVVSHFGLYLKIFLPFLKAHHLDQYQIPSGFLLIYFHRIQNERCLLSNNIEVHYKYQKF